MKLPGRIANPVLATVVEHSGFRSLDEFAAAVNDLGWHGRRLKLAYDHTTVKRWLAGGTCQHPDLVAEVLGRARGITIPVAVIWPQLRGGGPPADVHLLPCAAARTLEELAAYIGSDMLTRREALTDAVQVITGTALTGPLIHWLTAPTAGLPASATTSNRLTLATVEGVEAATAHFAAQDAAFGGGLSREAAVGQLKHAVDLLRDASYTDAIGNRMLAAVAELAGMAGWMSHDVNMNGPAQRYFVLGLHAARESTDPRSLLLRVSLLADMARQMHALERSDTGLHLVESAIDLLPNGRHPAARAMLWNLKARMLAATGSHAVAEVRHAVALAADLLAAADTGGDTEMIGYTSPAELAGNAALAFQDAARHVPGLAHQAEQQALFAVTHRPGGFTRSTVFDQISLCAARFTMAEPDQAAADGQIALDLAANVAASDRVLARLGRLLGHSEPYAERAAVRDLRDRITATLATT